MLIKPYHLPLVVHLPEDVTPADIIMNMILLTILIGASIYLFKKQKAEYKNKKS